MFSISKRDHSILLNILESIDKIIEFIAVFSDEKEFQKDTLRFDATIMNFIVIGEMVGKLSKELKINYNSIDWDKIYAFRNVIAHDYFGISEKEVWQIIQKDIPALKQAISNIV